MPLCHYALCPYAVRDILLFPLSYKLHLTLTHTSSAFTLLTSIIFLQKIGHLLDSKCTFKPPLLALTDFSPFKNYLLQIIAKNNLWFHSTPLGDVPVILSYFYDTY